MQSGADRLKPDLEAMMKYAGGLEAELIAIRRDLHSHPELLYDVARTSGKVAAHLESWGIEVRRNVGRHFGRESPGRCGERQGADR